ncbi:ABC transporter ATP-binding protein [Haloquadratum walsbyi]|uniref:ABC-type multidrug transport system, ATPase component n=1 Tax=Haloquadratum walsbyi J07HQW2 TaxID=1238425 RepID=U1PQV4_9EURY|nr:ABC transporter ATP-binding protein [Haloquadratum walsbyi]ERG96147.1 MAG: ABC-type multidrug transport system, ATPase component [Haloquadratum walsbyi J07HQW2]
MSAIDARDISKRYGTVTALDRVTLNVEPGEIFGFLGPNGAGKSTFLNLMLGFTQPSTGSISVFDHDCQQEGIMARDRIGVLPEGYDVIDHLTGRQHIEYAIRAKQVGNDADPLSVLDRVGLTEDAERMATEYSKGMKQRLVLGMALAGEPDLLLLDEPTAGLDPTGVAELRSIIRDENKRGATVFFSSHVLEQVEAVCDRVGILQNGELIAVDTINGLRSSLGGGTKLEITVDALQNGTVQTIQGIEGVETAVAPDNSTIEATCTNDAKMDILVGLQDAGVDVVNFRTQEASLEDMFIEYTESDRLHNNSNSNRSYNGTQQEVASDSSNQQQKDHYSQPKEQSQDSIQGSKSESEVPSK